RNSAYLRDRLLREARAMAKLAHPNVVAIHDVISHGDRLFLAMELIEGVAVSEWLTAERRGWRAILRVFIEAGRGLAAAHAAGLTHRDFKPDKVLIDEARRRVCVTDFGLVRVAARPPDDTVPADAQPLTMAGAILGTPAYMAPEQFRGEPAGARSDQFSFC